MGQAKILVVDDEADLELLILQKFRKKVAAGEYEFIFAKDGAEALKKISGDGPIDLILTDINMPVMDGLTLLLRISELENTLLRSVVVSAYGDMENIRTAMNRGAYDFLTKPIDLEDLDLTIRKSLNEIERYKTVIASHNKLVAFRKELDIATAIQTSILPKETFSDRKDFNICAKMVPAREVGGDLYDYFLIDKNRLAVIIGDVSGKGIASALLMAVTKTLLKATALKGIPPDSILSEVNSHLVENSPANMFVTVFFGILDLRSGAFEYSNAGHNLPYLISTEGKAKLIEKTGGFVLGAMKNIEYASNILMLKPEETLFFYTDGITEAFNGKEEQFQEARLEASLCSHLGSTPKELSENVLKDVKEFTTGVEQSDDITCLALRFNKK